MGFLSDNIAEKTILGAIADTGADPHEWYKKAGLMQGLGRLAGQYVVDPVAQAAPSINKGMTGQQLTPYDVANTFGLLADVGATTSVASGLMGGVKPNVVNSIPAWHGSPHRIDPKVGFMDEAIGTGEGAQAFGYGHYFTEAKDVANHYAKSLGEANVKIDGNDWSDVSFARKNWLNQLLRSGNPDYIERQLKKATESIEFENPQRSFQLDRDLKFIEKLQEKFKDGSLYDDVQFIPPDANLYRTTLHKGKNPSEYNYLEWDKPISEQSEGIKKSAKAILKRTRTRLANDGVDVTGIDKMLDRGDLWMEMMTGDQFNGFINRNLTNDHKKTAKLLKDFQIDGIKYPAGSLSGGNKNNTFNYVVFDPKDITIDEHYVNGLMQSLGDNNYLKENVVKLYRGLENEFDPNFDLHRTDAPTGYSTWTDNPYLAQQYGKNVYEIELPKNQQGQELFDIDGERVLFLDNQKNAGLNDISGKEYLIYNDHELYNPNLIKRIKVGKK